MSFLLSMLLGCALAQSSVVYVDVDAVGANDGSSWADAYVDLQDALASAGSGQVWVAEGTYLPGPAGLQSSTFALKSGVAVYGGFDGTETQLAQRDPDLHPVVLSGDLDGNAALRFTVPQSAPLQPLGFQAFVRRGPGGAASVATNAVLVPVYPAQ